MDRLEKVEKLRSKANVSYEEAKEALDASNDDILDAMVYLEKKGKVKKPSTEIYTTNYEDDNKYQDVKGTVEEQNKKDKSFGKKIKEVFLLILDKLKNNSLKIERHGEELIIPLWGVLIILLLAWHIALLAIVVSFFFNCRYSVVGKDDLKEVNDIMDKAADAADHVKDEFNKI